MSKLDILMKDLAKKHGEGVVTYGARNIVYGDKIPFSSPRLNYMTYGGFPIGKTTELIGEENGGKTTTALDAVANAQLFFLEKWEEQIQKLTSQVEQMGDGKTVQKKKKQLTEQLEQLKDDGPRRVVYVDTENTFDPEWAELNGVDVDALWIIQPQDQTAEQVLEMMLTILRTGEVGCMVLDSIPMLVSQKLFSKTVEDKAYGGIADAMSQFSAKVSSIIRRHQTALILINQVRENLNNPYDIWKTPGGRALRHLYALRLGLRKGAYLDEDCRELARNAGEPAGNQVSVTIVKTKTCKPDRKVGFYTLNYTNGVDEINDTIDVAMTYGYIVASGSWFKLTDPETGEIKQTEDGEFKVQGRHNLVSYFRENPDVFEEIYQAVNKRVMQ